VALTDELMKDAVCGIGWRNVVVGINDSQLCRVLKWMLVKAEQEKNTTKCLNSSKHQTDMSLKLTNFRLQNKYRNTELAQTLHK